MPSDTVGPPFDQFLATAEAVARARPNVYLEIAREVLLEAATLIHNGLASTVSTSTTLTRWSLGYASISLPRIPAPQCEHVPRQRWEAPGDLHDPENVSAAYLIAAAILQL